VHVPFVNKGFVKHGFWTILGLFDFKDSTNGLIQLHYLTPHVGKNIVKGTTATKVEILTKDCILDVFYMYWFIKKYQNYILNVISRTIY